MSVTFYVDSIPTGEFAFRCHADFERGVETFGPFVSRDDAVLAAEEHKLACTECDMYGLHIEAVQDVDAEVNLANANAAMILGVIGLDISDDLCGHMSGEAFLGHVLVALAQERDNAAVSATVDTAPGRATFIDCGLPEGYVNDTLARLADVATEAARLGRDVLWG